MNKQTELQHRILIYLFLFLLFLVACYATLQPALSVRPSVRRSVRPSVTLYFFWVFAVYGLTSPAQVIK